MITRAEYMARHMEPGAHQEYYGRFATPAVINLVSNRIGVERIRKSTDKHFNDIPLREWDQLQGPITAIVGGTIRKANGSGGLSLSDCVCTAKAAARKIKEGAAA